MAPVTLPEIKPGLVVFLDTARLRKVGGSETNAVRSPADRAVTGPHHFLILQVDNAMCLAVPLFSEPARDRDLLDASKKGGTLSKWLRGVHNASWYQHWRIPLAAVVQASIVEETQATDRCTYAAGDPATLTSLAERVKKNRCAFTAL
ncbi:MAG: hypothetical protein IT454_16730 [Planctomycetes bacterium]|nr:hypothetical protein [Planctomycetota bacterium]